MLRGGVEKPPSLYNVSYFKGIGAVLLMPSVARRAAVSAKRLGMRFHIPWQAAEVAVHNSVTTNETEWAGKIWHRYTTSSSLRTSNVILFPLQHYNSRCVSFLTEREMEFLAFAPQKFLVHRKFHCLGLFVQCQSSRQIYFRGLLWDSVPCQRKVFF